MRVALGVSGGIAAYKAAELVRLLQDKGLDVQVVMTRNAREFITPLTFAALSGHKVITDMFGEAQGSSNRRERHRAHRGGTVDRRPRDRPRHGQRAGQDGSRHR